MIEIRDGTLRQAVTGEGDAVNSRARTSAAAESPPLPLFTVPSPRDAEVPIAAPAETTTDLSRRRPCVFSDEDVAERGARYAGRETA